MGLIQASTMLSASTSSSGSWVTSLVSPFLSFISVSDVHPGLIHACHIISKNTIHQNKKLDVRTRRSRSPVQVPAQVPAQSPAQIPAQLAELPPAQPPAPPPAPLPSSEQENTPWGQIPSGRAGYIGEEVPAYQAPAYRAPACPENKMVWQLAEKA